MDILKQTLVDEQAKGVVNSEARDEEYRASLKKLKAEAEEHIQERSTLQKEFDAAVAALKGQLEVETTSQAALLEQLEATKTRLAVEASAF